VTSASSAGTPAAAPERILINGREAHALEPTERGLHYGDGLFETIASSRGRPRFLDLHLERLSAGAARLGIACDVSELRQEITQLAGAGRRAVVKLILSRGPALARGYRYSGAEQATRLLLRYPWPEHPADGEGAGVRVRLAQLRLGENPRLAGLKHLNRLEQVLARAEWSDPGIAEALLFSSSGTLVSGTTTNIFLVHDGTLCTPGLSRCGVAGTMRRVVRALASAAGLGGEERELSASELESASEVFLTNALIGIWPVRELAGRTLQPGPVTRTLQAQLAPLLERGTLPEELRRG
jgi:4-amino-4-deoxychorismate lyase